MEQALQNLCDALNSVEVPEGLANDVLVLQTDDGHEMEIHKVRPRDTQMLPSKAD